LLGSFFVFASISGYQNVGAATTIAVLVASQLVGGLAMDIFALTACRGGRYWGRCAAR
jgi:transporter family-2 protein